MYNVLISSVVLGHGLGVPLCILHNVAVYKCYVIQNSSPYSQLFNSLTLNAQLGTPQHLTAHVWQVQNVLQKEDHQLEIVPLDLGFAV